MQFVCHSYANRVYSYVMVCHSYILLCHPYVTRIYSYVIRMPLVCSSYVIRLSLVRIRMSSVCYSYVFVCHLYVTRIYSYVIFMSLVCGFTMNLSEEVLFHSLTSFPQLHFLFISQLLKEFYTSYKSSFSWIDYCPKAAIYA